MCKYMYSEKIDKSSEEDKGKHEKWNDLNHGGGFYD